MWLKGRYNTLHCIALHRAKRVSQTAIIDDDEGMEIEVLLIELHMYVLYSVHEERKMVRHMENTYVNRTYKIIVLPPLTLQFRS